MMDKENTKKLFHRYITGELSGEEFLIVEGLLKKGQNDELWQEVINEIKFEDRGALDDISKYNLLTRIMSTTNGSTSKPNLNYYSWIKYAAVVLISVGISWFVYQAQQPPKAEPVVVNYIEKSNAKGRKTTFNLPDGTIVKLNSSSRLSFPEYFNKNVREVVLEGEAFFEVTKNKEKPFVIKSGAITTTVLGTSFNVNAYPDAQHIQVAVLTGKVKVESPDEAHPVVFLEPNVRAVYEKGAKHVTTSSFVPEEVFAWKDGIILFKNAKERDVIKKLEEWYGVDIVVKNKRSRRWNLTAKFHNETLEHVLDVISHQIGFNFEIKNKNISINY